MQSERNAVGWFEIYVQDMKRAQAFYENTFAVKLENLPCPVPEMQMRVFGGEPGKPGCPGALVKMDGVPSGGGGTLIYFTCADCAVEEARAIKNGGNVHKPKFSIGQYGFISLVVDTEGNMIGLHSLT